MFVTEEVEYDVCVLFKQSHTGARAHTHTRTDTPTNILICFQTIIYK